jgi:hypothetical protein
MCAAGEGIAHPAQSFGSFDPRGVSQVWQAKEIN